MKLRNHKIITVAFVLGLITTSLLISCKDTGSKSAGNGLGPIIVVDCTIPGNEQKPDCIQKCVLDPTLSWCETEGGPKFTCPTDGSFKPVNPFSGQQLTFSDSPGSISDIEGFLAAEPFSDGEFSTLFINENSKLYINATTSRQLEDTTSKDLGINITSIDAAKLDDKYYAVIGTAEDFKIVEFYKGPTGNALFRDESTIEYKKLGGIKQVLITASVDLSGSSITTPPPGMQVAMSAPPPGTTTAEPETVESTNETFVYLLDYEGSVWRIKLQHLLNGGCFEMLYDVNDQDNMDGVRHMVGRKITAVGEHLAVLTSTMDSELPNLDSTAEEKLTEIERQLTEPPLPPAQPITVKTVTNNYSWFIKHLAKPKDSKDRIKILNLTKSKNGNFGEIKYSLGGNMRYFTTDMKFSGTKLYVTAYKYDINKMSEIENHTDIVMNMFNIFKMSATGVSSTLNEKAREFNNKSTAVILIIDPNDPNSISQHALVTPADTEESAAASIYTRLSSDNNTSYLRGTDKYLAVITNENFQQTEAAKIETGSTYVPWQTAYDPANNRLVTTFGLNVEIIDLSDKSAKIIE